MVGAVRSHGGPVESASERLSPGPGTLSRDDRVPPPACCLRSGVPPILPTVSSMERAYRTLSHAARRTAPLFALGDSKVARAIRARRGAADRLVEWARNGRDPERPLVWMHAPSVGEGLQARAVLEALLARAPGTQSVFTHFSPSAEALAARMPTDVAGTLPWDVEGEAGRAVEWVRPDVLVFTKTEVWPVLARAARDRGAATALIAATLPEGSSRSWWPVRAVVRPTLAVLDVVAAIAEPDATRLVALGAPSGSVRVTGDPGMDSAAVRVAAVAPDASYLRPLSSRDRPALIAGSTWPGDEAVLVPACIELRRRDPSVRVIVAPHEPEEGGMRVLETRLREVGWRTARLGETERVGTPSDADLIIVDRVGVLAELYTVADVAWVGGGFHGAGLHSVLEPAAAGLPVLFGPRHRGSRAAADLLECGGARVIEDVDGAVEALVAWLGDATARASAGAAAGRYIRAHLGAADRTAALLAELIAGIGGR